MKKIIVIGDTHGRKDWVNITTAHTDADKFIFVGDYFDTHEDVSVEEQIRNFELLIWVKENLFDNKVVFLIGNHDFHYLPYANEQYSGYQPKYANKIGSLLQKEIEKGNLQMSYVHDDILITHAGVTKTWCQNNNIDLQDIENSINQLFKTHPQAFRFTPSKRHNSYGDEICQTPIWVRPDSLYADKIDNFVQIVGHTTMKNIEPKEDLIFIDTIGTSGEYLEIKNDEIIVRKCTNS